LTDDDFSIVTVWTRAFQNRMKTVFFLVQDGYWIDIGTPQALARVHLDVIRKVVNLDIPDCLFINSEKGYAVPRSISGQDFQSLENAWVESESIGASNVIINSVVFKNSVIDNLTPIYNSLVTPFGVICLDEYR
jgi:ADP-glucose pyrophosphorylase